jgi:hypothetical protein
MGDHSSRPAFACGLKRPTRATSSNDAPEPRRFFAAPIRSCSRWGLPCRPCCQARGALLPHPFTVASPKRSPSALCGTFPDPSCEKPPGVTRHRRYAEPGLSSRALRHPRSPDPLASGVLAPCSAPVERLTVGGKRNGKTRVVIVLNATCGSHGVLSLPISEHPSFDRPAVTTKLWRYMDLPKFVDLLTSKRLWLANAEILAADDPYEGLPGAVQFPHRMWRSIDGVPDKLRQQILLLCSAGTDGTPDAAFKSWFMVEEQRCIMTQTGRRDFYVNCWHAADHESVAMWKIYGAPGAGIAIVSNGARVETALARNEQNLHLGAVHYHDSKFVQIGMSNVFDTITRKRESYKYEQEVRLVYWHVGESHDALVNANWNEEAMRFDNLVEDTRPIPPGISFECDVDNLIESVVVSPFAPAWFTTLIERVRDQLGFRFEVTSSTLLNLPVAIP